MNDSECTIIFKIVSCLIIFLNFYKAISLSLSRYWLQDSQSDRSENWQWMDPNRDWNLLYQRMHCVSMGEESLFIVRCSGKRLYQSEGLPFWQGQETSIESCVSVRFFQGILRIKASAVSVPQESDAEGKIGTSPVPFSCTWWMPTVLTLQTASIPLFWEAYLLPHGECVTMVPGNKHQIHTENCWD